MLTDQQEKIVRLTLIDMGMFLLSPNLADKEEKGVFLFIFFFFVEGENRLSFRYVFHFHWFQPVPWQ